MRKGLALLMALLMLVLPALGGAEEAAGVKDTAKGLLQELAQADYTLKYMAEGQQLVTDVSFEPGELLMSQIPEGFQAAVTDLLSALTIETAGQTTGHEAQGTLRLLLNGETALDATAAANRSGIYASSNFLGDLILKITPAQAKGLVKQAVQSLVESGQLPQEAVNAVLSAYHLLREDPEAFLVKAIGDPDFDALIMAALGLANVEEAEVTEIPEDVTIDAKTVTTITISKDGLKNVTTELAKFLWSMPAVQKAALLLPVNGQPLTEERLIRGLNLFPDTLAEDLVVRVYQTEDQQIAQSVTDVKLIAGDGEATEKVISTAELLADGMHVTYEARVTKEAEEVTVNGDILTSITANGGNMNYGISVTVAENGTEYMPLQETVTSVWTREENEISTSVVVNARAQETPDSEPLSLVYNIDASEKDLGDHAEENATLRVALDGLGEVMTVKVAARTDLAEAYLITEDALEPLSMSEEEQMTLLQQVSGTAMQKLTSLNAMLPESVQALVSLLMGGE